MKRIAFDLDGVIFDFVTALKERFKSYGVEYLESNNFKIETTLNMTDKFVYKCIDETIERYKLIKPFDGAIEFLHNVYGITKEPIHFITARQDKHLYETGRLIKRYLDIPFFLAMAGGYKNKIDYLKNFDYFVDDRRKTCLYIAERGKKVFMPKKNYNKLEVGYTSIIKIESLFEILPYLIGEENGINN